MLRRLLAPTFVLILLTPGPAEAAGTWRWPVRGEVLTAYRNGDDPYAAGQHRGIDIAGDVGTPVVAAVDGEVRYAGALGSSGIVVSVRTADGAYDTSYLHLSAVAVAAGAHVVAGDRLGAVGTTGERSAVAPHLHFGVREAGRRQAYLDPLGLLAAPPSPSAAAPQAAPVPHVVGAPVGRAAPVTVRAPASARAWRSPALGPAGALAVGHRAAAPHRSAIRLGASPPPVLARQPVALRGPVARASHHVARPAPARDARSARSARTPRSALGPGAARTANRAPDPHGRHATAGASTAHGPDLGWALACLGLLVAAACIGLPRRGAGAGRPSGRRGLTGRVRLTRAHS